MSYCPACGVEYVEGTRECMDCHVTLRPGPPPQRESEESDEPGQPRLVLIRVFTGPQQLMQADLARNILETEDIPCIMPARYIGEMLPGVEPIQLFVHKDDAERARELLESYLDPPREV